MVAHVVYEVKQEGLDLAFIRKRIW